MAKKADHHVLVADIGGTNLGVAIFSQSGKDRFEPVCHHAYHTRQIRNMPAFFRRYLRREGRRLDPKVQSACIDFAGPINSDRSTASLTNLDLTFTATEVIEATGIENLTLLNDFEAVGFGVEVLMANKPEAFVRLSRSGKLPPRSGVKPTALVLGAGTGLGTTVLIHDPVSGRYRPLPAEGGHVDFGAVEELDFRIAQWIRAHRNDSPDNPLNRERVVSGRGLANVFEALSELEPHLGGAEMRKTVFSAKVPDRPAIISKNAGRDTLCRRALDIWLRSYARAAKNSVILPMAPGGVFLAGGVAAKILPEMQSGTFMKEFLRCDIPNIRAILKRIPVFVVTDYRIGLYGCANVAVNGLV
jgi:glucokinase